jgi:peptidoglycan/LPS O-acetylase OafA/YrhL
MVGTAPRLSVLKTMAANRIVALDGLRGFAALAVAIPHFFMMLDPLAEIPELISITGVELFFVLSGFVLAPQILDCLKSDSPKRRYLVFLCRRWLRTLPPYILALTVAAIISHKLFSAAYFRHVFFLQNLTTIDLNNDFFAIAWSLSVEEWFYIGFPIFLYCAKRWFGLDIFRSLLIFFAAFFVIRTVGCFVDPDWPAFSRRLVIFRLDSIAFGFALHVWIDGMTTQRRKLLFNLSLPSLVLSGAAIVLVFKWVGHAAGAAEFAFIYAAPLFAGSMLVAFYAAEPLFRSAAVSGIATFFGDISYEVYLLHVAVNAAVVRIIPAANIHTKLAVFIVSLAIVCALVRRYFELPFLSLRPSYRTLAPEYIPTPKRRIRIVWRRVAVATVGAVCAFELLSYLAIHQTLARWKPDAFAHDYTNLATEMPGNAIDAWADKLFTPEVGWQNRPSIARTSKNSLGEDWSEATDANASMIAPDATGPRGIVTVYGDSYSEGAEVNSNQSWHNYLSVLTGLTVECFATGALGTDQVLFRLERDLQNGRRSKVVILGVHDENLKNIMSSYRGFYNHGDPHLIGFKPVYEDGPDGWHWVLPRLYRPKDRSSIAEALLWAAPHDHFYYINTLKPRDTFPYSLQLAKYWIYLLRTAGMGETYLADHGGDIGDFWKYRPATDRMMALFRHFAELGNEYGFTPVIVFIPEGGEVLRYWRSREQPLYATVAADTKRTIGIQTIDILTQPMDYQKFNIIPFGAHPSPYGNRVIATAIFDAIRGMPEIAPFAMVPRSASGETGVDENLTRMTQ